MSILGVELVFPAGIPNMTSAELIHHFKSKYNVNNIVSATTDSNVAAVVGFSTVANALKASKVFNDQIAGKSSPISNNELVRFKLTQHPSYVVEVNNFPTDKPVMDLQSALSNEEGFQTQNDVLMWNRSAIVKFKRHLDVAEGIKKLKTIAFDSTNSNQKVIVSKYKSEAAGPTSDYDSLDSMDKFDSMMNKDMNTEFLNTNPAIRYQFLKNTFERTLFDAKIRQDASLLIDDSSPILLKKEVVTALKQFHNATPTVEVKEQLEKRLFEIYLQRTDFSQFTKGFEQLSVLFGNPNEENPMDWSQFSDANLPSDFIRIQKKLLAMDKEALENPEVALGLKPAAKGSLFHKNDGKISAVEVPSSTVVDEPKLSAEELRKIALDKKIKREAEEQEHMLRFGYKMKNVDDEDEDKRDPLDRKESYTVVDDEGNQQVISMEDPLMLLPRRLCLVGVSCHIVV